MKSLFAISVLFFVASASVFAQADKKEVRDGNRKFRHNDFKNSEIQYRKALVKDSTSFAASYDLASALYMQKDYDGASKALGSIAEAAPESGHASDYAYNLGCTAIQQKDWDAAIKAFRTTLLEHPEDMDAKENYVYAKLMKQNQENQQNQDQNQNQDQDQNQNQDQNQDQDQNQNQDQNQDSKPQPQQQKVSPQQAQQMLKAIQAKEKETQDKVEKEKAARLETRQKEKNW